MGTNVSEERISRLHSVTSQKNEVLIFTNVTLISQRIASYSTQEISKYRSKNVYTII
jgi:hypothetical protein